MKVGDLVDYKGWKAIIAEVNPHRFGDRKDGWQAMGVFYSLHFLGTAPTYLRRGKGGFYAGFQTWQLEVVSATL